MGRGNKVRRKVVEGVYGSGDRRKGDVVIKGHRRDPYTDGLILYLNCDSGYTNLHM